VPNHILTDNQFSLHVNYHIWKTEIWVYPFQLHKQEVAVMEAQFYWLNAQVL
jgi:hypothetical protein